MSARVCSSAFRTGHFSNRDVVEENIVQRRPIAIPSSLVATSAGVAVLLIVSGIRPYDRLTWLLEVAPVLIALPIMWATYRRFPLTTLLYWAVFLHAVVLIYGGAYTYSRVPLGDELQAIFTLSRNPYDKIGHFMQGFAPALAAISYVAGGCWHS
jgi:putative membrane protein